MRSFRGPTSILRRWRRQLLALLVLGSIALVAWLALPVALSSEPGRELVRRTLERTIDEGIRGSVRIGAIDRIAGRTVHASDVVFTDESGRPVIEAEDVRLELDFGALVSGRFLSPRGRVYGGRVILETTEDGTLLLDRAFEPPSPGPDAPPGDDVVRLENLVVQGIEIVLSIRGAPSGHVRGASAIVRVQAPEHAAVILRADRLDGAVDVATPVPIALEVDDGTLTIRGDGRRRVVVDLPATVHGEPFDVGAVVTANEREELHVALELAPGSIGGAFFGTPIVAQALLADAATDGMDVTLRP